MKINKIFSSRADQMMLYVSSKDAEHNSLQTSPIRRRRPDRILGFQHTDGFDNRLNETARNVQNESEPIPIRQLIEITVTNDKSNLLLFPFLVMEAKAEDGEGLNACDIQTALPIQKMLRIQEDVQARS